MQIGVFAKRRALKVALATTTIVAGALVVICLVIDVAVVRNEIAHVDQRIVNAAHNTAQRLEGTSSGMTPADVSDPEQHELSLPLAAWVIGDQNQVLLSSQDAPALPVEVRHVTAPLTVRVNNVNLRVTGQALGNDWLIVGQSLAVTDMDLDTLISTEVIVAPLLIFITFAGAYLVGTRTAAPIETARQRQLEFSADASHELRTPLAVIEAETALALNREREAPELRQSIERISTEAGRLRHIVESLLWLSRFDAEPEPPSPEPVDIAVIAASAVERFAPVGERRGVTVQGDVPDLPALIVAPPEWLDRLCGVLLDNACKFAPEGGHVRVSVAVSSTAVTLAIDDDGPGIAESERHQVFDRFHRASATEHEVGAGLGLAIGDAVVGATKGHWDISSSDLGGARIAVTWPPATP